MRSKKNYVCVALLLGVGISLLHLMPQEESVELLTLKNVEAIASGETDSEGRITCYSSFIGKDNGNKTVKDCGDCMDVDCIDASDKGKCKK